MVRINEYAQELLIPNEISFKLDSNIPKGKPLPVDIRQNLFLLCKEAMTNAAKHSNGDRVTIVFDKKAKELVLSIHDNGNSAPKEYKTTGLGLSNMKMRAESIGGTLSIDSSDGFKIEVNLKGGAPFPLPP